MSVSLPVMSDSLRPHAWTVAHQALLSMGFSRQEYWSGLPFPSPGIFLTQGSNPGLLQCRQILYHLSHQGNPFEDYHMLKISLDQYVPEEIIGIDDACYRSQVC